MSKGYIVFMPDGPEVIDGGVDYDRIPKDTIIFSLLNRIWLIKADLPGMPWQKIADGDVNAELKATALLLGGWA